MANEKLEWHNVNLATIDANPTTKAFWEAYGKAREQFDAALAKVLKDAGICPKGMDVAVSHKWGKVAVAWAKPGTSASTVNTISLPSAAKERLERRATR